MTSTSRRVFGPKDNHLFSTQSSASCWLFEDPPPENNDFKTILESFRRIVGQQRQEVMLFSENLLFDRIFTTQREALVQWMTEVCSILCALPATLHLSVALLDARFYLDHPPKAKYQLIAASAMLVAAKFYENLSDNPLDQDTLSHFTDDCYSPNEILLDESGLLGAIHFSVNIITPSCFLSLFTEELAFRTPCDRLKGQIVEQDSTLQKIRKKVSRKANYFASMTLHAYGFRKYLPQDIAASCLAASRQCVGIQPIWSREMERLSGSQFHEFQPCYWVILNAYKRLEGIIVNGE